MRVWLRLTLGDHIMNPSDNILATLGQANYIWQIAKDRLDWSENFRSLIGFDQSVDINSARSFETLLSSESQQTRFAVLQSSIAEARPGEGSVYQCVYAISPRQTSHDEPVWVEDTQKHFAQSGGEFHALPGQIVPEHRPQFGRVAKQRVI